MKTLDGLIKFCEDLGFGFSIARSSGGAQFTVFIHTTIVEEGNEVSIYTQSLYVDDAIGMTIEKVKLLISKTVKTTQP